MRPSLQLCCGKSGAPAAGANSLCPACRIACAEDHISAACCSKTLPGIVDLLCLDYLYLRVDFVVSAVTNDLVCLGYASYECRNCNLPELRITLNC